jgi:outer membrane protein TolC
MTAGARILKLPLTLSALALLILTGCATADIEQNLARTNTEAASFTDGKLNLARDDDQRERRRQAASTLLSAPVGQKEAVQLALVNSPALQALLAQNWADAASAAQSGRIANPVFSFQRIVYGGGLDIERTLAFGLLDLLTLPQRQRIADQRMEQAQLRLTGDVIDQVTLVRQAWVRAVTAQQTVKYAHQVYLSAEASAELARRMEVVGNFNKLTRARHQTFYADAATRLASAQQETRSAREKLIRLLGLNDEQAEQLKLPERLPDLPEQPDPPEQVAQKAIAGRLDIRLAQSALNSAAKAQGLNTIGSFTDIELSLKRNTAFGDSGPATSQRGYEIGLSLPIFDWGDMQRDALSAQTLAAANRLEATVRAAGAHLRESYSAYRTAYDISRHYRDEVVPLRKTIAEENLLRYNGMIIGVFELLSDSRDQIGAVIAAIGAQEQFWLADAALQATLVGRPTSAAIASPGGGQPAADTKAH